MELVEDLTLTTTTSGSGTISLGPVGAGTFPTSNAIEINTLTITGAGAITLNGASTHNEAANNEVSITGDVILDI